MPKCRGCEAEIEWLTMPTGKKMPVDAKAETRVYLVNGVYVVGPTWMPHWATCPEACRFRGAEGREDSGRTNEDAPGSKSRVS